MPELQSQTKWHGFYGSPRVIVSRSVCFVYYLRLVHLTILFTLYSLTFAMVKGGWFAGDKEYESED